MFSYARDNDSDFLAPDEAAALKHVLSAPSRPLRSAVLPQSQMPATRILVAGVEEALCSKPSMHMRVLCSEWDPVRGGRAGRRRDILSLLIWLATSNCFLKPDAAAAYAVRDQHFEDSERERRKIHSSAN